MNSVDLQAALQAGNRVYGTCIVSTSPAWPSMIAGLGLDFVFIDTEHIPIGRETLAWMCRAYDALGLAPIVRVPAPDPYLACMALDAGAAGVVFPYVETVEQVQALRGAVKCRTLKGERLQRYLAGEETLEPALAEDLAKRARGKLLIVNIESQAALDRLDDILAVPDLDALLIGPHDLSINLGVPSLWDHSRFLDAIATIIQKARAAGVGVGVHYSAGIEAEIRWAREGANLIVHSSDLALVDQTLRSDLAYFRAELGDVSRISADSADTTTI